MIATACPLCKKTFAGATSTRVADIAEIVAEAIIIPGSEKNTSERKTSKMIEPAGINWK